MLEWLKVIQKNNTYEMVHTPLHKKANGVKWLYRTKLIIDGSTNKYKSRIVVKRH